MIRRKATNIIDAAAGYVVAQLKKVDAVGSEKLVFVFEKIESKECTEQEISNILFDSSPDVVESFE